MTTVSGASFRSASAVDSAAAPKASAILPRSSDGVGAWQRWEAANRQAHEAFLAAVAAWEPEHGHRLRVEDAVAVPDQPFDPAADL